ncbi:MAG: lipopolysaccharide biosynthesis protein [Chitinophagaceae bacterium]|nr:lipopolysaccharide biosynthesis protein [Chitinophagaceae bacterium]
MSTIRKQSLISTGIIYFGFAIGLLNTYFFTREGTFTESEYGLTTIFIAITSMIMAFANMAMPTFIFKFYPYYHDHLPPKKNDMLTWALLVSTVGFILVVITGIILKQVIIRKFSENSPMLVSYYYWTFVMGFGVTIYNILEVYSWNLGKSVLTNFLKEVQWRIFVSILIALYLTHSISDFDIFIKLYAFTYPVLALILFLYLVIKKKIHFTFKVSRVSRRYFRNIVNLCVYAYSGLIIFTVSQVADSLVIAAVLDDGLSKAGIFGLAQLMTSVIQVPQRGIVAASIGHLSRAWKEKNTELLRRIYQRSSINLLVFASGIFILIALNYKEAVTSFELKEKYLLGFDVFILLGLSRVIDLGTGVNAQIIATSTYWKFELFSGVILLVLMLPLTYILTKQYDIIGPAIAHMISITIYNGIRILFLWRNFSLFPFTIKSAYTVLLAAACFVITYYLFRSLHGIPGMIVRTLGFIIIYGAGVFYLKLSPDVIPVLQTIRKRFRGRND